MGRIIMHIDLNAFFATAEELKDPSLVGKPLAVGGIGRRGVVSTASYEARKYGVHSAMPMFKALELCPKLIVKEPDFHYYSMLSISFISYLKRYSQLIEQASIDECYVDMSEQLKNEKHPYMYLKNLQDGLLKEIGLKCSIGLAPTKFLAKMGSDMKKPMGITIIRKNEIKEKIYPLPIESFFGIGKKTSPKLREMGITTIGDLADLVNKDDPRLMDMFGKMYPTIKDWVNGRGNDMVDLEPWDAKSLGHSETFAFDSDDHFFIEEKIKELSMRVSEGAKRKKKIGKTVQLQVKDTSFKSHDKSFTMLEYTNDYKVILEQALRLYRENFSGMEIRLVGVTLQNLIDPRKSTFQMSLFNYEEYEEMDKTQILVNELNRKMKKKVFKLGSEAKKNGRN